MRRAEEEDGAAEECELAGEAVHVGERAAMGAVRTMQGR
jgi:hypothetical protein